MSNNVDLSPDKGIFTIELFDPIQRAATKADADQAIVLTKSRIVAVSGRVNTIGGTTKPTDVDLMVEKGTTDVLSAAIACVDSSTNAGPLAGALVGTAATLAVAAGDVLHLDATVTGGASPTIDGIGATVYLVRE